MKTLNIICAVVWFASFVALFFGYEPDKVIVGCSFLISGLGFVLGVIDEGGR